MEWNRQNIKYLLLVIFSGVLFFCALQNLGATLSVLKWLLSVVAPLLLGCAIAFILNVPMRAIERHLFPRSQKCSALRRPLALILALMSVAAVLVLASAVIRPGIEEALSSIISQIPAALDRLQSWALRFEAYLPYLSEALEGIDPANWQELSGKAVGLLQKWGKGLLSTGSGLIGGVVSMITTLLIGLIFSFYILLQKEKLARHGRQVFYALLPEHAADKWLDILRLSSRTFSNFLSGQCLEAVILGSMFIVVMSIFRFPYVLLIGVLIALMALIPIVALSSAAA